MSSANEKPEQGKQLTEAQQKRQQIGKIVAPRLPYHEIIEQRFGIDVATWKALCESLYPNAKTTDAVILALAYCKARKLDIMKKPVHIVPMWNSELGREVETVWPAITEHRITAHRTGVYAGTDPTRFGPDVTKHFEAKIKKGKRAGQIVSADVTFPEWAEVTVYRLVDGEKMAFPGPRVKWMEYFGMNVGLPVPNARWARAPLQMLEKCAEAAALRKAFTEEIGGEPVAEEMEGRIVEQVLAAMDKDRPNARTKPSDHFVAENEVIDETPVTVAAETIDEDDEAEEEPHDTVTGELGAKVETAKPAEEKTDRGAIWLADRLGEISKASRELLVQKDKNVREVLAAEQREADLLPKWESAVKNRLAQLDAETPPAEVQKADAPIEEQRTAAELSPADQQYEDWKKDQYQLLANAKMTRSVDDIQDQVLPDLREADRAPWIQACNAKAKDLLQAGGKGAK